MSSLLCTILLTGFLANSKPQRTTSNDSLSDNVMDGLTTKRANSTTEIAVSPHRTTEAQHTITEMLPITTQSRIQAVTLADLPLEILFMIFDYTACRDHLSDQDYIIRFRYSSSGRTLVISQPSLLMTCKSLRSALSDRFYSSCSFHAKFGTASLLERVDNGLTVQRLDDMLPYPLKLNTIRLTLNISRLAVGGFDISSLVELGKKLFVDYQAMELNPGVGVKLMNLNWRLEFGTGNSFFWEYEDEEFSEDLQLLLDDIHAAAALSVLESDTLQEFDSWLETWLKEDGDYSSPTHYVRETLRQFSRSRHSTGQRA